MGGVSLASAALTSDSTISRFHWKLELLVGLNVAFSAVETGILTSALAQIVRDWSLSPVQMGAVITGNGVGGLLGALVVGNIADRWGRKISLQIALLLLALGAGLSALAWDLTSLVAFQFLTGMGIGGIAPPTGALVAEFAPAKHRGRLLGLMEVFFISGWLLAATSAYFLIPHFGWRAGFVLGVFPALYIPILRMALPESPRYLISHGRQEEASDIVRSVEGRYGVKLSIGLADPQEAMGAKARFAELWSPELIRRTACTWILWFVLVYSFSGIFMWMPTLLVAAGQGITRSFEFALVITLAQLPGVLAASLLMDRIGRKRILIPALLLCGVASYFFGQDVSPQNLLIWGPLISAGNLGAWSVMLAYTPELFPTRVRGTGAGWASACGRIGAILVPGVMALIIGDWGGSYALLFGMFAAVQIGGGLTVALLGEETVGRTLEEIAT